MGAPDPNASRVARTSRLPDLLRERILVLDGAMGTMIQTHQLDEAAFRGDRFRDHPSDLKGANDLLVLTQPDVIRGIHAEYLEAGADIVSTNTFNANADLAGRLRPRVVGGGDERGRGAPRARRPRTRPRRATRAARGSWPGSLGPTTRTASLSPDVNDPGARNVTWEELRRAYHEAARGLVDGWRGHPAHRDHLRHAQRQGRHLRGRAAVRGAGRSAAR